jgi:ABC-2 type transport system ATP-binding protein
VKEQEVFGFLGPNGAGKTTAIRHLMGFLNADKGTCSINSLDCRKQSAEIMNYAGYLPGEIALFDTMSAVHFFRFMANLRHQKDLTFCNQLVERFDLDTRVTIKKMSKGMKQKVAIVTAFMHDPQVLVLDEPTSGLDPLMQREFSKLIVEEKKRGKTILMSSHNFDEVEKNCDTIGIIRQGKMVCVEDIHTIHRNKQKNYTLTFTSNQEALQFAQTKNFSIANVTGMSVEVKQVKNLDDLIKELGDYHLLDIQSENYSLENLFMHYYGGEKS